MYISRDFLFPQFVEFQPLDTLGRGKLLDLDHGEGLQAQVLLHQPMHGHHGHLKLSGKAPDGNIGVGIDLGAHIIHNGGGAVGLRPAKPGGIVGGTTVLIGLPGLVHSIDVDTHGSGDRSFWLTSLDVHNNNLPQFVRSHFVHEWELNLVWNQHCHIAMCLLSCPYKFLPNYYFMDLLKLTSVSTHWHMVHLVYGNGSLSSPFSLSSSLTREPRFFAVIFWQFRVTICSQSYTKYGDVKSWCDMISAFAWLIFFCTLSTIVPLCIDNALFKRERENLALLKHLIYHLHISKAPLSRPFSLSFLLPRYFAIIYWLYIINLKMENTKKSHCTFFKHWCKTFPKCH